MITNEERREIAANLREYQADLVAAIHGRDKGCTAYVVDLMDIVDLDAEHVTELFARLADLIEPEPERTCRWVSVGERLPDCAGEYIVAYHPCYHAVVNENKTLIGMDSFMGKTAWAKRKYQSVTHWMPKPELPKVVEK